MPRSHFLLGGLLVGVAAAAGCGPPPRQVSRTDAGTLPDVAAPDLRTPDAGAGPTQLHVRVFDSKSGARIPAKLLLTDAGTGAPLAFGNFFDPPWCSGMGTSLIEIGFGGALATWNGIALWRGEAVIPIGVAWDVDAQCLHKRAWQTDRKQMIPHGRYHMLVSRGLEYEITEVDLDLGAGRGVVFVDVPLSRTVDTRGYFAADMHIHTSPGSSDSSVTADDRVKTEVTVGIEVLVSSDHDFLTDFGDSLRRLWPDVADPAPAVSIVGDEASANYGHFNAMPLAVDRSRPAHGAIPSDEVKTLTPQTLFDRLHAAPTAPIVQLNHPRLGGAGYFSSMSCGGGWTDLSRRPSCPVDFEAMEVLNGFLGCDTAIHQSLADWYALLRLGVITTATGNSDTHYTSGILAGFPRTYVRVARDDIGAFDEREFIDALRGYRAVATTGPFITLQVDGRGDEGDLVTNTTGRVGVSLRMQAASWVRPDTVRLLVNGRVVKEWALSSTGGRAVFEIKDESLAIGADAFVTAEAEGRSPLPSWLVGEYLATPGNCPSSPSVTPGMIPFAVTNPVFIDADGDGVFKAIAQPVVVVPPPDVWIPPPFPDGEADCDPAGRRH